MKIRHPMLFVVTMALVIGILACGGQAQAPEPTPTPNVIAQGTIVQPVVDDGLKYDTNKLYDMANQLATDTVTSRTHASAWILRISIAFAVLLLGVWFSVSRWGWSIVLILMLLSSYIGGTVVTNKIPEKVDTIGHDLANKAVTDGVAYAQKAQATNWQYIHANIKQIGVDQIYCQRTVNYTDECSASTPYYTTRDINPHDCYCHNVCTSTDSDGNCTSTAEVCSTCYDTEYTPWFDTLYKYWFIPDTKARYLSEQIYHQRCLAEDGAIVDCTRDPESNLINDSRNPVIYAEFDWRAPEDVSAHRYTGGTYVPDLGYYNNHVPDAWVLARDNAASGGQPVDGTFVGPYFNWGFAADDVQFDVYTGHYQNLVNLVPLPGPSGVVFNYTDAYGQPATLPTMLTSTDGDLPVWFNPITAIGVDLDPALMVTLQEEAMVFQGNFGPFKHGSARWFLVSDSIVTRLGGMENTTSAIKAYLRDENVWGLFSMPKNLVILVTSVSDDGKYITGRSMDTGMPFGNVVVMQDVRMSIPSGTTLPLAPENLMGSFDAHYNATTSTTFTYEYSDLSQAGGVIGILYMQDPTYQEPDVNDPACITAPAAHHGFILYKMCTQQYMQTTIKVNQKGADLIMQTVYDGAIEATPQRGYWIFLIIVAVLWILTGLGKAGVFEVMFY